MWEEEKEMKFQKETLDKIDFLPYIKKYKGKKLWDLIYAVEEDYDNTELSNNDILEGCIFNWFSEYEISEYLEKRYPGEFRATEISYQVIC